MSEADLRGKLNPTLQPVPGSQHLRFVGDTIRFELSMAQTTAAPLKVCLRTTLGQAREDQQNQPGQGRGERRGDQENPQTAQNRGGQPNRRPDGNRDTGGGSGGSDVFRNLDDLDFDGPLTGLDFRDWEDRLREVEEVIEIPELRNQVSEVRQSARDIRRENKENGKPPMWDLVDMQILRPMTEINKRLERRLSLRQPKRELIPVDHEPVPAQYSELVRRYYERLGGRKEKNDTRN